MLASIPTPSISVIEIGAITIHAYALCIITGVAAAIWLGNKRFISSTPGADGVVADVAIVAIPAGVIGGRLYHVITTPERFFGESGNLLDIVKIWEGGLGIWGAISLGALAAFFTYKKIAAERVLPSFATFADALAPALLVAQAIGRWGNWFNGELFGRPTDLPWALEIPSALRPAGFLEYSTFHPTFLYESLWCALLALVLIYLTPRLAAGQLFSLYIVGYSTGRLFIEMLRIDPAHQIAGVRINILISLLVMTSGALAFRHFSKSRR